MTDSPVTLFIPFGQGYGSPGLTIRGDSVAEIDKELKVLTDSVDDQPGLLDSILTSTETVRAAALLKFPQEAKSSSKPVAQASAAQVSSGATPNCNHGAMVHKQGVSRSTGKAYSGYFCPAPQGVPGGQCKPQFA